MTERPVDPTGRRALFEAAGAVPGPPGGVSARSPGPALSPAPGPEGKAALFSAEPRRRGTVTVECSGCHARRRVSLADLGLRLATGSAWVPLHRGHPHWMRCPSCHRRQWCRIGWSE
jgi:hypothetical protein